MKSAFFLLSVIAALHVDAQFNLIAAKSTAIDIKAMLPPVNGKVTTVNGEPLAGVTVTIKGSSAGTETDANGNFTLNVDVGQVLVFSFVGYEQQEVAVTNETATINIQMTARNAILEEVVVDWRWVHVPNSVRVGDGGCHPALPLRFPRTT